MYCYYFNLSASGCCILTSHDLKKLDGEWTEISGRCRIRDVIGDADISEIEQIKFYIWATAPGIDIWLDNVSVTVWQRDDSWVQGK